ncbi:DUF4127 family protein [Micromonospora sp. WMMD737]|uniref:DUF4127 family protein n=1 Tax=Micromonospora sp. WMMD737 TaxID=3404113 RepID=UPI003B92E489
MSGVVAVLPLDDRPVTYRQVAELGELSGATVLLPPRHMLGRRGAAGDLPALAGWIEQAAGHGDALVVSLNQLVHGGYVPSRRTTETMADWLPRLQVLHRLRDTRPDLRIYAHTVLMRTKARNDAGAEPAYWADHGRYFGDLSRELYRAEHGRPDQVADARAAIPAKLITDLVRRRVQLHQLQLHALSMTADGIIDLLAITPEDTTAESMSTSEREWLQAWIGRYGIADRALCYPGADEVGSVLLGRAVLGASGRPAPTALVLCAVDGGLDRIAAYEDVPVGQTIAAQLEAAGLRRACSVDGADLVVAVHPPGLPERDWFHPSAGQASAQDRGAAAQVLADQVAELVGRGHRVVVADVADANGSDPALVEALRARLPLDRLAGYAGWNTAGNSIGSTLAQGCATMTGADVPGIARRRVLTRRFLDDWAYQTQGRALLRPTGTTHPSALSAEPDATMLAVEALLAERLAELPGLAGACRLRPGSVHLPWGRSFEVDFELDAAEEHDG